jgi:plasmid stabilization system protein ParE
MKQVVLAAIVFMTGCAVGEDLPCEFSYQADAELQSIAEEAAERWSPTAAAHAADAALGAYLRVLATSAAKGVLQ